MPSQSDLAHLLRRTEFVARPARLRELASLSLEAAVDNILSDPGDPGPLQYNPSSDRWHRILDMTHHWFDRMAHDSVRPLQEKMGLFWHGHFCSDFVKVVSSESMREQNHLFRRDGLGNLVSLTKVMSTQVAMLRYLDNNLNRSTSPNQNFARELMELFLMGVGNYSEADVEACAAAWTGHTDDAATDTYSWRPDWHDSTPKSFLGYVISSGGDPRFHGYETIDVILGAGRVPSDAAAVANRGRPTREVAAEFISRKLWAAFAGTAIPPTVLSALRAKALATGFEIRPWLREMLLRPEFYSSDVKLGLVRSPVETVVAMMSSTNLRSVAHAPTWLLGGMGQLPFYPPDVSGWKTNGYWVNAAAMANRAEAGRHFAWRTMNNYWNNGSIDLAYDRIPYTDVIGSSPSVLVDRIANALGITLSAATRNTLIQHATSSDPSVDRKELPALMLLSPDFHLA